MKYKQKQYCSYLKKNAGCFNSRNSALKFITHNYLTNKLTPFYCCCCEKFHITNNIKLNNEKDSMKEFNIGLTNKKEHRNRINRIKKTNKEEQRELTKANHLCNINNVDASKRLVLIKDKIKKTTSEIEEAKRFDKKKLKELYIIREELHKLRKKYS